MLSILLHMGLFVALASLHIPVAPLVAFQTPIELIEPPTSRTSGFSQAAGISRGGALGGLIWNLKGHAGLAPS